MAFTPIQAAVAVPVSMPDRKWDRQAIQALIERLQAARDTFGLKGKHFQILRMLASFVREFTVEGRPIVFASNKVMQERAGGMNEQTLRRHINELIRMDLVERISSPNGKRYVHRNADREIVAAFGIDLSPLLRHAHQIEAAAAEAYAGALHRRLLKDRISLLLRTMERDDPRAIELRNLARRPKAALSELEWAYEELHRAAVQHDQFTPADPELDAPAPDVVTEAPCPEAPAITGVTAIQTGVLTGNDGQIDRHYQSSIPNIIESKREGAGNRVAEPQPDMSEICYEDAENIHPAVICDACPEALSYAQERPRSWADLFRLACLISPMMGIKDILAGRALSRLGPSGYTVTILCILQRLGSIRNPCAYLASLLDGERGYSPTRFLRSLAPKDGLAA